MSKFGWCLDGHHAGKTYQYSKPCPGVNAHLTCSCECHTDSGQNGGSRFRKSGRKTRRKVEDVELPPNDGLGDPRLVLSGSQAYRGG